VEVVIRAANFERRVGVGDKVCVANVLLMSCYCVANVLLLCCERVAANVLLTCC